MERAFLFSHVVVFWYDYRVSSTSEFSKWRIDSRSANSAGLFTDALHLLASVLGCHIFAVDVRGGVRVLAFAWIITSTAASAGSVTGSADAVIAGGAGIQVAFGARSASKRHRITR